VNSSEVVLILFQNIFHEGFFVITIIGD
jgi:hypothetical protein